MLQWNVVSPFRPPIVRVSGHFHAPEVPSFPVAQLARGERKRRLIIFSHGLCGNRSMYSTFVAEIASHVIFVSMVDILGESQSEQQKTKSVYMHVVIAPDNGFSYLRDTLATFCRVYFAELRVS